MSFAENLQYLRKRDQITQEELADQLGVSRQSVSKWETGEAYPETEKILALCDVFHVTMDDLMRRDVAAQREPVQSASPTAQPAPCSTDGAKENCFFGKEGEAATDGAEEPRSGNEEEAPPPEAQKHIRQLRSVGGALSGAVCAGAIAAFFCLGGLRGLWHPAWLVFPLALSLCAFFDRAFDLGKRGGVRPIARILKGLAGMTILLSVTIYLFIGCVYRIWHPSWIIFIVAVILTAAFDRIAEALGAPDDEKDEKAEEHA